MPGIPDSESSMIVTMAVLRLWSGKPVDDCYGWAKRQYVALQNARGSRCPEEYDRFIDKLCEELNY